MSEMIEATIEIAYLDAREPRRDVPAQVRFDNDGLTLIASDDRGEDVLWHGERRGQGHFLLSVPDADMDASLHRFTDSSILEGFWRRGGVRGFWRLHLSD